MIYDALVVGENPSAMVAAALLVRKKMKVAWIVSPDHTGPSGEGMGGAKVPDLAWDLLPRKLVESLLQHLGIPFRHLEKDEKMGGGIQVVCPEFRTMSIDGPREFRRELKRIFALSDSEAGRLAGRETENVAGDFLSRYWGPLFKGTPVAKKRSFPLISTGERVAPQSLNLEGVPLTPSLKRLVELIAFSQSYLSRWVFPRPLVAHFIRNFARLNIFAQGRLISPDQIFREVFQLGGGEIFPGEAGIFLEPHREKGISLWLNSKEVLNGTVCLLAVSPDEAPGIYERLARSPRRHGKEGATEATSVTHLVFTLHPRGVPGGMGENLILYTGSAMEPFSPEKLAFLSLERADDQTIEGHYTVFHAGNPPGEDMGVWAEAQIQRLEGLFPFMTRHLILRKIVRAGDHPLSLRHYFYSATRKRRLGAPERKEGGLGRNVRYIGRRQLDYLGLEGEVISGFKGSAWALDRLSKI